MRRKGCMGQKGQKGTERAEREFAINHCPRLRLCLLILLSLLSETMLAPLISLPLYHHQISRAAQHLPNSPN